MRWSGRAFEWVVARVAHRPRRDLYHSALEVRTPMGRVVVEQAPAWGRAGARGVVTGGAVGLRAAGRLRLFRYEVRCWRDGVIPDAAEAAGGPPRVNDDAACAERLLALVPCVPTPVWGRDELGAGEMWNSNSVISWLLTRAGVDARAHVTDDTDPVGAVACAAPRPWRARGRPGPTEGAGPGVPPTSRRGGAPCPVPTGSPRASRSAHASAGS